jgi:hypothetical protein
MPTMMLVLVLIARSSSQSDPVERVLTSLRQGRSLAPARRCWSVECIKFDMLLRSNLEIHIEILDEHQPE